MQLQQINHLEVILKTVERCNINCTYCYFFNGIDQSFMKHPPYIKSDTIKQIANFLAQGCQQYNIPHIRIDLHGGEPLMQKQQDFTALCDTFVEVLAPLTEISFSIQTNGILINDSWLELLARYNVHIGISLDGPKAFNDRYRIDKRGRGTYDRVVQGIKLAQCYARTHGLAEPAVLSVVNPEFSGNEIYRHFVDELEFKNLDFLLPDITHDAAQTMTDFDAIRYGEFLCNVLAEWVKDDNPSIYIRILNSTLSLFVGGETNLVGYGDSRNKTVAFTIASDGSIAPDDTLRSTDPKYMETNMTVFKDQLTDFIRHPTMRLLQKSSETLPQYCKKCPWNSVCGGGFMVNRYSEAKRFENASIMCAGLQLFYQNIYDYLASHGALAEMTLKI